MECRRVRGQDHVGSIGMRRGNLKGEEAVKSILWIGIGGFCGAIARFLIGSWLSGTFGTAAFPVVETLRLIEQNQIPFALLYATGSVVAGLIGAWVGGALGRIMS